MKVKLYIQPITLIMILISSSCNKDDFDNGVPFIRDLNETVIDIDGNIYHTIQIGKQIWMKENLNVTKYRNGESINDSNLRYWNSFYSGGWCEHPQMDKAGKRSGKLYNFGAVNSTKGLAPKGWHVPSDEEWNILVENLGSNGVAGGKMKEMGTSHWATPNKDADNSSGFTALPGGYITDTGQSFGLGSFIACWWSRTNASSNNYNHDAYYRFITFDSSIIFKDIANRYFGFSVRCIKDY